MNTITRCPACRTAFRVHRHQLEARGGQVRCGACGVVFDARAELEVLETPVASSQPMSVEPEPFETLDLDLSQPLSTTNPVVVSAMRTGVPASVDAPGEAAEHPDEYPLQEAAAKQAPTIADTALAVDADDATLPPPSIPPIYGELPSLAEAPPGGIDDDAFDFGAGRRERRRRGILWALASIPLVLALALQAAYYFRAEVAALAPWARPWLEAACGRLGCEVELPKHASLLTVESAHLEAEGGDVLILYATLRNRADFDQALPAIELTLTDAREQAVARRLLAPRDYYSGGNPRIVANGELAVRIPFEATGVKASGFRLEALYTP
jgi:predicted Zn finger-like uncharacterized protein